jgi:hypothetical protein
LSPDFKIEPLSPNHDRAAFFCGKEPLDDYLKTQAQKAVEKYLAAVFMHADGSKIAGYYTRSSLAVRLDEIQKPLRRS